MRLKERIPLFLNLVDYTKLAKHWNLKDSERKSIILSSKDIRDYWKENYDQQFGQVLINLGIIEDNFDRWNDEYDSILFDQGYKERDVLFWESFYDKDMNRLDETKIRLIKDLDTDHIKAILDGYSDRIPLLYKSAFTEELNLRNE